MLWNRPCTSKKEKRECITPFLTDGKICTRTGWHILCGRECLFKKLPGMGLTSQEVACKEFFAGLSFIFSWVRLAVHLPTLSTYALDHNLLNILERNPLYVLHWNLLEIWRYLVSAGSVFQRAGQVAPLEKQSPLLTRSSPVVEIGWGNSDSNPRLLNRSGVCCSSAEAWMQSWCLRRGFHHFKETSMI